MEKHTQEMRIIFRVVRRFRRVDVHLVTGRWERRFVGGDSRMVVVLFVGVCLLYIMDWRTGEQDIFRLDGESVPIKWCV